ncbi:MAG: hypothetical protein GEU78_07995 [Actinobacteria bacterium]|nr:hypothetical protein [Actinomycetota bacterium]
MTIQDDLTDRLRAGIDRVSHHLQGNGAVASIPADPDRDVDLLLARAIDRIDRLTARLTGFVAEDRWKMLRTYAADAKHHARLSYQYMREAEAAEARLAEAEKALEEYACTGDPEKPCGCEVILRPILEKRAEAQVKALEGLLQECADDLEDHVKAEWPSREQYPHQMVKFERDMEPVRKARAALAGEPND